MNQVVSEITLPNNARLEIVHGDLTQESLAQIRIILIGHPTLSATTEAMTAHPNP